MKKVAIYTRVSTNEQFKEGYSIDAQKERLLSYCKAKDWIVRDIFIDGGCSGSNLDRPSLNRLLGSMEDIDIVLVYKLDRLSRSQKDTLFLIEDKFLKNNVDFVSVTENFDTTTPFGRAMIGILSVFAQLERENIKERVTMGRIERAKKGLWCGTPNPPIGYDLLDSNLIINEYEALQVKEIFDLYIKGYGGMAIQNKLVAKGYTTKYGTWESISTHTIPRIIKNKVYIGEISYAKKWYKGIHDPIIPNNIFETANNYFESRKGNPTTPKYFLSGLLFCKECGGKYVADKKGERTFYICINRKLAYKQDLKCKNTIFNTEVLESVATNKIKELVKNKDKVIEKFNQLNNIDKHDPNNSIEERIIEIDKQIKKLMDLYQFNTIPVQELSSRLEILNNEKKLISSKITIDEAVSDIDIEDILDQLTEFNKVWNCLDVEEKKVIASALLGPKILVSEKGI